MFGDFLKKNINAVYGNKIPKYVEVGFGQVEPNHLSAQRTSQVYAQLPAAADIDLLQQGQFVKYNYKDGQVDFAGAGEWMLVYNEIKLYRDFQNDCEFAMIKDNYNARVYSPFGGSRDGAADVVNYNGQGGKQTRYYGGKYADGQMINGSANWYMANGKIYKEDPFTAATDYAEGTTYYTKDGNNYVKAVIASEEEFEEATGLYTVDTSKEGFALDKVTVPGDMYEVHYNDDPFHIEGLYKEQMMKEGTTMVPRVFKTNVGDIFTTNTVDEDTLAVGDILRPRATDGILVKNSNESMQWQVVKVYTMPDHQRGVKIMRIA